jgi:NodT family efflux transporter outer membrane factor (OMF) lipoprotein
LRPPFDILNVEKGVKSIYRPKWNTAWLSDGWFCIVSKSIWTRFSVGVPVVATAVRALKRSHLVVMTSLALSLAACAVGPDFRPPEAPLVRNFIGANNRSIKNNFEDYRDWWNAFHDPTLSQLVQTAYEQNLTLLSAGTRVLQARAALGIAVGQFYPQVQQGVGDLAYNRTSAATPGAPPDSSPRRFWTNALAAQAVWELDFWGKFRRGVESSDATYLASIATYDQVLVSLLGDVAATYIGIRTTEQLLAIARDNVRKQEDELRIAQVRFHNGSASELDVFQATNVLEATRSAIPQLDIQLQQGRDALCVLLGIPPEPLGRLLANSRGIQMPPATIAVGIPADLLRRRPDIRAAELAAMAQSAQIGIAESQLYPAISISGTFGGTASTANGHNLSQVFKSVGMAYAGGPSFQWNILNYGQITNNVRVQDATLQQLLVDYQNDVLQAEQQVEDGISAFLNSRVQAQSLRRSADAADGALKLATLRYEAGESDFTTVLTAAQNLFQAQSNLATARSNVLLGATQIYRALGGGWQIRDDNEFVTEAAREQMRARTNWGDVLPPAGRPQPTPGLPAPKDVGPLVRLPQW